MKTIVAAVLLTLAASASAAPHCEPGTYLWQKACVDIRGDETPAQKRAVLRQYQREDREALKAAQKTERAAAKLDPAAVLAKRHK